MNELDYQIDLAIEECSELIQALCKHKRALAEDKTLRVDKSQIRESIKEEIADVNIILSILQEIYFENKYELDEFISKKLRRTEILSK